MPSKSGMSTHFLQSITCLNGQIQQFTLKGMSSFCNEKAAVCSYANTRPADTQCPGMGEEGTIQTCLLYQKPFLSLICGVWRGAGWIWKRTTIPLSSRKEEVQSVPEVRETGWRAGWVVPPGKDTEASPGEQEDIRSSLSRWASIEGLLPKMQLKLGLWFRE